jgi:hypothetical protein
MPTYIGDVIGIFKKIHAYIQQAKKTPISLIPEGSLAETGARGDGTSD